MSVLIRRFVGPCICIPLIAGFILMTGSSSMATTPKSQPAQKEDFPVYPVIKPNVDFWIDIFTKYSRGDGVLHDRWNLSRIYERITLDPAKTRKAARKNRKIKKKALDSYEAILLNLARGKAPTTTEEKKVAALFGKNPIPEVLKQAARNLRIQTGLKQQFKEGMIRSGALMDEYKRIFRSYGLPEDLVYLPCVESSFDVTAYSKFGAAGIWQFTRGTGKLYMEIGYVVDQRRDPIASTHGAARLLKRNYAALGEWPLALTAYNHGLNGMKRAKKQKGTYPRIYTSYRSRAFNFASRNFYSEFLAARQVGKHYKAYFGNLDLDKPVKYTWFTTRGFVPAAELARGLGLDLASLRQMNPALRKPVFDGRKYIPKGFDLRLPKGISTEAATRVASGLYRKKQKPSKFHVVWKGDTAGAIARLHKVSLNDLIMANALDRRATIYIGQTLRIPAAGEAILKKKKAVVPGKRKAEKAKPVKVVAAKKEKPKAGGKPVGSPEPDTGSKPEEVPAAIAKASQPGPTAPARTEEVKIEPGKMAAREAEGQANPAEAAADVNLTTVTSDLRIQKIIQSKKTALRIIHVAPGETLGHYADWLGIPTRKIRKLNCLTFGRPISIGQEIRIPLPENGSDRFEAQRYEFHQEILEDFFDSFLVAGVETYEVKPGDTLWSLSVNELKIPLWLLRKYNPGMDLNALQPRQKILYPLISPTGVDTTLNFRIKAIPGDKRQGDQIPSPCFFFKPLNWA